MPIEVEKRTKPNYLGMSSLTLSIGFGVFSLYVNYKNDLDLDRVLSGFISTFFNSSIVYSYFSWTIFLTIYGVLNLFEDVYDHGPEKSETTLVARNFNYDLYWWATAAVLYQQFALTVNSESLSLISYIFPETFDWPRVVLALVLGLWGLHHVIAGRIYINGYWTPDIHLYQDHKIINRGIYKYVRHPIYGGQFLFTLSIFIMWNNWILLLFPLATILANIKRAHTEEKELDRILNGAYSDYKRLTPSYMVCYPTWSRLVDD